MEIAVTLEPGEMPFSWRTGVVIDSVIQVWAPLQECISDPEEVQQCMVRFLSLIKRLRFIIQISAISIIFDPDHEMCTCLIYETHQFAAVAKFE